MGRPVWMGSFLNPGGEMFEFFRGLKPVIAIGILIIGIFWVASWVQKNEVPSPTKRILFIPKQ